MRTSLVLKGALALLMCVVACLALIGNANAQIPNLISYQGRLTDTDGNAVADGSYQIVFTIYDAAETALWQETHGAVATNDGLFAVLLGAGDHTGWGPLNDSVFSDSVRWLGVKVGSDPEMLPRSRLASIGFAHRVSTVDGASGGQISGVVNIPDGLVVGDTIGGSGRDLTGVVAPKLRALGGAGVNEVVVDPDIGFFVQNGLGETVAKMGVNGEIECKNLHVKENSIHDGTETFNNIIVNGTSEHNGDETYNASIIVPQNDGGNVTINSSGITIENPSGTAVMINGGAVWYNVPSLHDSIEIYNRGLIVPYPESPDPENTGILVNPGTGIEIKSDPDVPKFWADTSGNVVNQGMLTNYGGTIFYGDGIHNGIETHYGGAQFVMSDLLQAYTFDPDFGFTVGDDISQPAAAITPEGSVECSAFRMPTGASDGYVLTSNEDGNGTWQAPTSTMPKILTGAANGITHGVTGKITVWFNVGHTDEFSSPPVIFVDASDPSNGLTKHGEVATTTLAYFEVWIMTSVGGALVLGAGVDVRYMAIGQ
jgi:hypothetical protein